MNIQKQLTLFAFFLCLILSFTTTAQKRLGLHFTQEELNIWRERAVKGPYKTTGDAGTNSPGDWDRIVEYKDRFLTNPNKVRYSGPPGSGCVFDNVSPVEGREIPLKSAMAEMQDAAFYALIKNDAGIKRIVKDQLLWIARNPRVNFNNTNIWCRNLKNDGSPNFDMAIWGVFLLTTYEYVETEFTTSEKAVFDNWIKGMASYLEWAVNIKLDHLWSNRGVSKIENYIYTYLPFLGEKTSANGNVTTQLQRCYNNRNAHMIQLVGLVGVKYNNASFIKSAKNYVKEAIAFLSYSNGLFGELHRSTYQLPSLGLGYLANTFGCMISIADALARKGDFSLYDYKTTYGWGGSEGKNVKSLQWIITEYGRFVDGQKKVYSKEGTVGNEYFRIDGTHGNWIMLHDVSQFVMANVYYKNAYNKSVYMRNGKGMTPYPVRAYATNASLLPWKGLTGNVAGLFTFGQMEGKVWPYPSKPSQDVVFPEFDPEVSAGEDKTLVLPTNTLSLTGTATDEDGTIVSYAWEKVSGPSVTMTSADKATLVLSKLVAGNYVFKLTAKDNSGASSSDEIEVEVVNSTSSPTAGNKTFYRAINLNGIQTVIDGKTWEASSRAANFSFVGKTFVNNSVALSPSTDANKTSMLRSSIWRGAGAKSVDLTVKAVPAGQYEVYLYTWEDNFSTSFQVLVENSLVGTIISGGKGSWKKIALGKVNVTDGSIVVKAQGGDANLSGLEIWKVSGSSSSAARIALEESEEINTDLFSTVLYPNPFENGFTILLSEEEKKSTSVQCKISDFAGSTVFTSNVTPGLDGNIAFNNLGSLKSGTYLIHITAGSTVRNIRAIKQ